MLAEKLPDWLLKYTNRISDLGAFNGKAANHVLVNEYKPGEGIMVNTVLILLFTTHLKLIPLLMTLCNGLCDVRIGVTDYSL